MISSAKFKRGIKKAKKNGKRGVSSAEETNCRNGRRDRNGRDV